MPDLVIVGESSQFVTVTDTQFGVVVTQEASTLVVQEVSAQVIEVAAVGPQGAQGLTGPQGPQGEPAMDPALFFQVGNRFYEIAANEPAKQTARENLGLATIDGGTFF